MNLSSIVFHELVEADVDWILGAGERRSTAAGTELITADRMPGAIHLVLEGVLEVVAPGPPERTLAVLGPGEIVGELTFVEGTPPTESVRSREDSTILAIGYDMLRARFDEDPAFATRYYRGIARTLSTRLRGTNALLAAERDPSDEAHVLWAPLEAALAHTRERVQELDEAGRRNGGKVPEELAREFVDDAMRLIDRVERTLGDEAPSATSLKQEVGARLRKDWLPFLLLSELGDRIHAKPRGYAGDFLTIEWVYENRPTGRGPIGPVLDHCLLELPPARAVRNRRGLLVEEILRTSPGIEGSPSRVTTLACGPAREMFDAFATLDDPSDVHATLLDFDLQALAFVSEARDRLGLGSRMRLVNENLIHLALGRSHLPIQGQDLVYSIGLIDYFADKLVVKLLDWTHGILRPGGRVILGNFHPRNPGKAFMDHVLDWKLIHRSEEDMNTLFERSAFGGPATRIRFEEEGINLFAECVKS